MRKSVTQTSLRQTELGCTLATSHRASSMWPWRHAWWMGCQPSSSFESTDAPFARALSTAAMSPSLQLHETAARMDDSSSKRKGWHKHPSRRHSERETRLSNSHCPPDSFPHSLTAPLAHQFPNGFEMLLPVPEGSVRAALAGEFAGSESAAIVVVGSVWMRFSCAIAS